MICFCFIITLEHIVLWNSAVTNRKERLYEKIKYFLSLGVAAILVMAIGITCFAAESNFSDEKKFVDSNYKQIYVKGTSLGTGVLVTKGSWVEVPIPSGSSIKGNNILLYGKGHNPSLDCYVSGYWNVH